MKTLVLFATITVATLGIVAVAGSGPTLPPEDSDLQASWSNLHACLRQDSAQVAAVNAHVHEMGRLARWLAENPGSLPTDSVSREHRKLARDFKRLYAEHHSSYSRVLAALVVFRNAANAEVPFDESKVGTCPTPGTVRDR